ncbi:MAG: TIM barrel protein [Acidimicrobiales bacterium]
MSTPAPDGSAAVDWMLAGPLGYDRRRRWREMAGAVVRTGMCSISFRSLGVDAIVELAAAAGLDGIEWGADGHVPIGDLGTARRVADACADAGLACPSYGTYLGMPGSEGTPADAVATARALGADNLRVWAPMGIDHDAAPEARAEIATTIREIKLVAEGAGLTVGIEYHGWTLTSTSASATALVREVALRQRVHLLAAELLGCLGQRRSDRAAGGTRAGERRRRPPPRVLVAGDGAATALGGARTWSPCSPTLPDR